VSGVKLEKIIGRRISLKKFSSVHVECQGYHNWLRDPEVIRTLNLPEYIRAPVSADSIRHYCSQLMNSSNNFFFALHLNEQSEFIGTAKIGSVNKYSGTADLGIMIGRKDLWGHGYATEAIELLCGAAFKQLKIRRLTAGSMSNNPGMIRVFEKLGFKIEGIMRQHDRTEEGYVDHVHLGCFECEFDEMVGKQR
jgi:[ribosomal protein S5]-alanine N-acetyltransferase